MPPTSANSSSNFRSRTFRTLTASSTISVPMPSPGRTAIFIGVLSLVTETQYPDAEGAEVTQKAQKKTSKVFFVFFATSAKFLRLLRPVVGFLKRMRQPGLGGQTLGFEGLDLVG